MAHFPDKRRKDKKKDQTTRERKSGQIEHHIIKLKRKNKSSDGD